MWQKNYVRIDYSEETLKAVTEIPQGQRADYAECMKPGYLAKILMNDELFNIWTGEQVFLYRKRKEEYYTGMFVYIDEGLRSQFLDLLQKKIPKDYSFFHEKTSNLLRWDIEKSIPESERFSDRYIELYMALRYAIKNLDLVLIDFPDLIYKTGHQAFIPQSTIENERLFVIRPVFDQQVTTYYLNPNIRNYFIIGWDDNIQIYNAYKISYRKAHPYKENTMVHFQFDQKKGKIKMLAKNLKTGKADSLTLVLDYIPIRGIVAIRTFLDQIEG